ncbi:MAG: hypothetical protein ABI249_07620 [Ornithinibacter sp.]
MDSPEDICSLAGAPVVTGGSYRAAAHSVVLLSADLHAQDDGLPTARQDGQPALA